MQHMGHPTPATCTSCSEPHECRFCRFRDAMCLFCRKMGHTTRSCHSRAPGRHLARKQATHQEDLYPEELYFTSTRQQQLLRLPRPSSPPKIKVLVSTEGSPCETELDTGSSISIIPTETLCKLCPEGGPSWFLPTFSWTSKRTLFQCWGWGSSESRTGGLMAT